MKKNLLILVVVAGLAVAAYFFLGQKRTAPRTTAVNTGTGGRADDSFLGSLVRLLGGEKKAQGGPSYVPSLVQASSGAFRSLINVGRDLFGGNSRGFSPAYNVPDATPVDLGSSVTDITDTFDFPDTTGFDFDSTAPDYDFA